MRVAIAGVGLIGGSIGLALRELADTTTIAWDPDHEALDAALARGAIDKRADSLSEAVSQVEVCFVCAPVGQLRGVVSQALASAGDDCVVSDVGSTKAAIVAHTDDQRFIGGHPVAGAEGAGIAYADARLFDGAAWYLTPGKRSSGLLYERLHRLLVNMGASPVAIDAATHDRLLATVSHLPHVVANALVLQAADARSSEQDALVRVGPSFRDATRVAGANAAIWTDIYRTNAEAIAAEIDKLVDHLNGVAEALRGDDRDWIAGWQGSARRGRTQLLETELAGGALYELRVFVPNRPGVVAQIAVELGRAGVNIADMALAPASDMRSGAVSLWVAGADQAHRASERIERLGFTVASQDR